MQQGLKSRAGMQRGGGLAGGGKGAEGVRRRLDGRAAVALGVPAGTLGADATRGSSGVLHRGNERGMQGVRGRRRGACGQSRAPLLVGGEEAPGRGAACARGRTITSAMLLPLQPTHPL